MFYEVMLRDVAQGDLPILFEQQMEAGGVYMSAFPSRDRKAFDEHWTKILGDETVLTRTICFDGEVAGYIGSFVMHGKREIGYWIGERFWGKEIATRALSAFLQIDKCRPLFAGVAKRNVASMRVLEKCGFNVFADEKEFANFQGEMLEGFIMELK